MRYLVIAAIFLTALAAEDVAASPSSKQFPVVVTDRTLAETVPSEAQVIRFEGVSPSLVETVLARLKTPFSLAFEKVELTPRLLESVGSHGSSLTELRLANCPMEQGVRLAVANTLAKLVVLQRLDFREQPYELPHDAGADRQVCAQEATFLDWTLLAAAEFPRLTSLEVLSALEDRDLAERVESNWAKRLPRLTTLRLPYRHPNAASLRIADRTDTLRHISLRWSGDDIQPADALIVHRLLLRLESVELIDPPQWESGDPLPFERPSGAVWDGVAESTTLVSVSIKSDAFEKQLEVLVKNKSIVKFSMPSEIGSEASSRFANGLLKQTSIKEFDFGGGELGYLKGVPNERLAEVSVAFGRLLPKSVRDIDLLFKTKPVSKLILDGSAFGNTVHPDLDRALAAGLAKWTSLKALHLGFLWARTPPSIINVVREMPALQRLALHDIDDEEWIADSAFPCLVDLRVHRVVDSQVFGRVVRQLAALSTFCCYAMSDVFAGAAVLAELPSLERVELGFEGDIGQVLSVLAQNNGLTRVVLSGKGSVRKLPSPDNGKKAQVRSVTLYSADVKATDVLVLHESFPSLRRIEAAANIEKNRDVAEYFDGHPEVEVVFMLGVLNMNRDFD